MMEERYHATTENRFYPDTSNVNKNITVEAKLISPPTCMSRHNGFRQPSFVSTRSSLTHDKEAGIRIWSRNCIKAHGDLGLWFYTPLLYGVQKMVGKLHHLTLDFTATSC